MVTPEIKPINEQDFREFELHKAEVLTEIDNEMKTCCNSVSDKRLILLSAQIGFSSLVLIFSGLMIALKDDDQDKSVYVSLLSSVLSFWLGNQLSEKK